MAGRGIMSSYPDANYAALPEYPSAIGDSCAKPSPYTFYDGGTFCSDVTVNSNIHISGALDTKVLIVDGVTYKKTLFLNQYDGEFYYVLATKAGVIQ
jgi:hypothetical protein